MHHPMYTKSRDLLYIGWSVKGDIINMYLNFFPTVTAYKTYCHGIYLFSVVYIYIYIYIIFYVYVYLYYCMPDYEISASAPPPP